MSPMTTSWAITPQFHLFAEGIEQSWAAMKFLLLPGFMRGTSLLFIPSTKIHAWLPHFSQETFVSMVACEVASLLLQVWYFAGAVLKKWLMDYDTSFLGVEESCRCSSVGR